MTRCVVGGRAHVTVRAVQGVGESLRVVIRRHDFAIRIRHRADAVHGIVCETRRVTRRRAGDGLRGGDDASLQIVLPGLIVAQRVAQTRAASVSFVVVRNVVVTECDGVLNG